jgi:8-amino-7-oxononanoate synthase
MYTPMDSLDAYARAKLTRLEQDALRRYLAETERGPTVARRDGAPLISFSCNDYLGLSHHPEVKAAAAEALARYGAGSGASRLVTGNHPLYRVLEEKLAALKDAEDACVFGSGYLANLGIVPALAGPDDLVLADALSHACLLAGAKLSGATVIVFRHNDLDQVAEILATHRAAHPRCLILTDGVFSMDGDLAPLVELGALARQWDAWLMADDAHGIGVIGGGRGSSFATGAKADVPLKMGTLSKAIGSYGGYLCASRPVAELVRNRARTFVYSTGLPPATVAASIAAVDIIARDPAFCAEPVRKARLFTDRLGLPAPESPIVPVVLGAPERALAASAALMRDGFLVAAIRPPTVPQGTARLRVAFSAAHADADVMRLADRVAAILVAGRPAARSAAAE